MRVEFWVTGKATAKWLADVMPAYGQAIEDDQPKYVAPSPDVTSAVAAIVRAETVAEVRENIVGEPPKKRGRKAAAPAPVSDEEKPNISASPEDRRDPAQTPPVPDDAEDVSDMFDDGEPVAAAERVYTVEDVRDALKQVVNSEGMPAAIAFLERVAGVRKMSDLDPADYGKVMQALGDRNG